MCVGFLPVQIAAISLVGWNRVPVVTHRQRSPIIPSISLANKNQNI